MYGLYSDNNKTGTNFERPGFQQMILDAESGKINCIIVKDLTRFGRNAIDAGYYLERYLPALGVRFIAVTDSYDSLEDDGGILLPLKNIISESYALDIGRKCRAVHRQNIIEGRFVGRLAPYGYKKAPDDCHKLIIDEETAPIVHQIFMWAYSGVGINEIARRLSAEGIPSPSHHNYAKGFNTSEKLLGTICWKRNTVKNILTDMVYIGDMVQGKTKKVNNKEIRIEPSEWIHVPNTHEGIVSQDIFGYIQALLQGAFEKALAVKAMPYTQNVFAGKIVCASCGYPLRRKRQNTDGIYWFRCDSQWLYGKGACTVVSVKEADLKTEILTTLHKQSEAILGRYICMEKEAAKPGNSTAELHKINLELNKGGRMLKSLYESMVSGLITKDEFVQMNAGYEAKIELLSQQAEEIRRCQREAKNLVEGYSEFADAVSAAISDDTLTRGIIDMLVEEIQVSPDKSINLLFKFKDEFEGVRCVG
jgi:DNA invertase Pin-like site-specific DNA recombinase